MKDSEHMEVCLNHIAEKTDNIAPRVYRKFFRLYPESKNLFGIDPGDQVKSAMIVSLLLELLGLANGETPVYQVQRWANDHIGYGVTLPMFTNMLDCLDQSVMEVLGDTWSKGMQSAWQNQYQKLQVLVQKVYQSI